MRSPNVVHLRDRRETGVHLLDALDHEVRMMASIICIFEQLKRLLADCDDGMELLLSHYVRLQSIQRLALSLHERDASLPS
jgi:hypothetical protein